MELFCTRLLFFRSFVEWPFYCKYLVYKYVYHIISSKGDTTNNE